MGSGISSVTISSEFGGFSRELTEVTPGEFNCDEPLPSPCEDIASLAEISALGDLTFTFVGDPIFSPVTDTMWAPDNMVDGAFYLFELSYFEAIEFEDPRTTTGARAFDYTGAFESYNVSAFMVPEPGVIALNAVALMTVFAIARRRG